MTESFQFAVSKKNNNAELCRKGSRSEVWWSKKSWLGVFLPVHEVPPPRGV